jgi:predicted transcriptional regulator
MRIETDRIEKHEFQRMKAMIFTSELRSRYSQRVLEQENGDQKSQQENLSARENQWRENQLQDRIAQTRTSPKSSSNTKGNKTYFSIEEQQDYNRST